MRVLIALLPTLAALQATTAQGQRATVLGSTR
jgi:hypothetical protein